MLDYYKQKQIIANVDKDGQVIGQIEKWEAHRKGILHKALTVAIKFNGKFMVQHRKHPAFDKTYDITSSSHQLFIKGRLQTTDEAAIECLKREWNLEKKQIGRIKNHGAIYYKAKDPNSEFTEHELCDILTVELISKPEPNLDFAYDALLASIEDLTNEKSRIYKNLAPWVKKMIEEGKI